MKSTPFPGRHAVHQAQPRLAARVDDSEADYAYLESQEKNFRTSDFDFYLNILKRRVWCIVFTTCCIVLIVFLGLLFKEKTYQASTRILIEDGNPHVLNIKEVVIPDKSKSFYQTEYKLIQNRENIEEVIDRLQLDRIVHSKKQNFITKSKKLLEPFINIWDFLKNKIMNLATLVSEDTMTISINHEEARRQRALARFYQSLKIEPLKVDPQEDTKLVDIRISGPDPLLVAKQANMLAEIYIRKNLAKKLEVNRKAIDWLSDQSEELKKHMYDAESKLQRLRGEKRFISLDLDPEEKRSLISITLNELNSEYNKTLNERISLESRLKSIEYIYNIDGETILNSDQDTITSLKQKYLNLKDEYASLQKKYNIYHPIIIQKKIQIDEIKSDIREELKKIIKSTRAEYNIVRSKEVALEKEIDKKKDEAIKLSNEMVFYNALKRDTESYRNLYFEASQRLREIKLAQAQTTNNIHIVEKASIPTQPASSTNTLQMLLSVIIGCSVGVGFAFIREYFDTGLKDVEEAERYLQIPFLNIIPHHTATLHNAGSALLEAYSLLRTRLQASAPELKTLLVTSAVPGEGKTTTAAYLGLAFARLGRKVLLVDVDLRQPSLHGLFRVQNNPGLTDILVQECDWRQVIQDTSVVHLHILPTGMVPHDHPSDVLSLATMQRLVEHLREAFDLVIFDAPMALGVSDVEVLAPGMDGVLFVHSPGRSVKTEVLEATRVLQRAGGNIVGVVFNNVSPKQQKNFSRKHYPGSVVSRIPSRDAALIMARLDNLSKFG